MRKLVRGGFCFIYAKGSHYYFQHPITKRMTAVPPHGGKSIGKGLLNKIIKQTGFSAKEFIEL